MTNQIVVEKIKVLDLRRQRPGDRIHRHLPRLAMKKNVSGWPVMKRQCATCPFRTDERGRYRNPELVATSQVMLLSEASRICHHPRLKGKKETHICRGARDWQLEIFYRMGFLSAPTDRAWNEKFSELEK